MNLHLSGHHLEVTDSMRNYITGKLDRVKRHFDHVIDVHVTLTVEKLEQKAEATLHVSGADIHAVAVDENMYAAIDSLADKLMGPDERAMIAGHPLATVLENDTPENRQSPEVQSAAATLVIRTKFRSESTRLNSSHT